MGTKQKVWWYCDRCHVEHEKKPARPVGAPIVLLEFSEEYATAPGQSFRWVDMCPACSKEVQDQMRMIMGSAKKVRHPPS